MLNRWKNFNELGKIICSFIILFIFLIILSISLNIFTNTSIFSAMRITFGSIYVLFIPGFIISYIFFPKTKELEEKREHIAGMEKGSIDIIERIALSFALSIAIVPLVVFYLNLIGLEINVLNSFLIILGINLVSLGILVYMNKRIIQ